MQSRLITIFWQKHICIKKKKDYNSALTNWFVTIHLNQMRLFFRKGKGYCRKIKCLANKQYVSLS